MELSIAKTMVSRAFDNDRVDGRALKAFRGAKRCLRRGSNAKQTLSIGAYLGLVDASPMHLRGIVIVAFSTGMRMGELLAVLSSKILDRWYSPTIL